MGEQKQQEEEVKEEETMKIELPEWYKQMSAIQPGQPMKLYAIAYREANKNMEAAVNWLMDKGHKYLMDHVKEFADEQSAKPWSCAVCTFKNEGSDAKCAMCQSAKPIEA